MELVDVRPEDRELLWNITQKYLYEMTYFYDDKMDAHGNIEYEYFDAYFTEPERKAFFLYEEKDLVGFAMMRSYPYTEVETHLVLTEFTVFPMYRRKHLAKKAAEMIFDRFKGVWEVKYNEENAAGKALWNQLAEKYHPDKTSLNETETLLTFSS